MGCDRGARSFLEKSKGCVGIRFVVRRPGLAVFSFPNRYRDALDDRVHSRLSDILENDRLPGREDERKDLRVFEKLIDGCSRAWTASVAVIVEHHDPAEQ